jgi:hypothetical protein
MSGKGRTLPFRGEGGEVCNRRVSPFPAHPGEGPLTEPTPVAQACPGGMDLRAPHLPFAITAGIGSIGWTAVFQGEALGDGVAP